MWYTKPARDVVEEFRTNQTSGLTLKEALKRLRLYGPNILPEPKKPPVILKLFAQFKNFLVIILIFAAIISFIVGDALDAIVIAAIVLLNATIGFIQEVGAEKNLDALKATEKLNVLVVRDGETEELPSENLVPGDILILEEGSKIPSDGRIIEAYSLKIDESILTGESLPVTKRDESIVGELPLGDQINMVFRDSQIVSGRGKAVVTATGQHTEIGKIAAFLGTHEDSVTPLTKEIDGVAKMLTIIISAIAAMIFLYSLLGQLALFESLLLSISLAVAAIPEGLPAIITIVLSLGVKRMAIKKTIVRKLPSVETLGGIRIIATDKTGTITQNKIRVVEICVSGQRYVLKTLEGKTTFFDEEKHIINPIANPLLEKLITIGVVANNATLHESNKDRDEPKVIGDTTEGALLLAGSGVGISFKNIKQNYKRVFEVPFSSERKLMSVITTINNTDDHMLYVKGAPEVVLSKCKISEIEKEAILADTELFAKKGLRSLAIAEKKLSKKDVKIALEEEILAEEDLTFIGLVGMQDPLRAEIKPAIEAAKLAGIRTIMITGDHQETARTIAIEAGITTPSDPVYTEKDFERLTDEEFKKLLMENANVFARISPMGKLRIVETLKKIPHTHIAVTGDGVNDAPALKASHIGIAMGRSGTDVTRQIADMVITDDNYATIIDAIREGRVIFANLVKFTRYLISCNISEVIIIAFSVFFVMPIPLLPLQILWINLITDGLPALALGVDPPEYDVMKRPPRDLSLGILHRKRWAYMISEGMVMGAGVLIIFLYSLTKFTLVESQTIAFTSLALMQLVHALNNRSTRASIFKLGIFSNPYLLLAIGVSFLLQLLAVQTNFGNSIFKTQALTLPEWFLIFEGVLAFFLLIELKKLLRFRILP
ncbi:cation-transporting P-type ATPase [Candidatus Gottesmanbacteria bacterium]|nr:cation-transporting P-type ATPase [Candidatus Gottesmanbacteria bacterium]